jgi:hypothetical protein
MDRKTDRYCVSDIHAPCLVLIKASRGQLRKGKLNNNCEEKRIEIRATVTNYKYKIAKGQVLGAYIT